MNLIEALEALERATGFKPIPSGNEFKAKCPAHDDGNPSLSVSQGDNGQVLFHCFACCTFKEIIAHLKIDDGGNGGRKSRSKWDFTATYD